MHHFLSLLQVIVYLKLQTQIRTLSLRNNCCFIFSISLEETCGTREKTREKYKTNLNTWGYQWKRTCEVKIFIWPPNKNGAEMILARELQLQRNLRKIQASTRFEPFKICLATNTRLRSKFGSSARLVCERTGFDSRPAKPETFFNLLSSSPTAMINFFLDQMNCDIHIITDL